MNNVVICNSLEEVRENIDRPDRVKTTKMTRALILIVSILNLMSCSTTSQDPNGCPSSGARPKGIPHQKYIELKEYEGTYNIDIDCAQMNFEALKEARCSQCSYYCKHDMLHYEQLKEIQIKCTIGKKEPDELRKVTLKKAEYRFQSQRFMDGAELLLAEMPNWDPGASQDISKGCNLLFALLFAADKHESYKEELIFCPGEFREKRFATDNRKYLPILKTAPLMPREAVSEGIEGYVLLQYDISKNGRPKNIRIIESEHKIFNKPAIDSVKKYKYLPSIKNGKEVVEKGVISKITFQIEP